ncbi:cellulose-binding protein [Actinokineospora sp. UTMC 2448]|uniref:cellulose-binding protein n=1 Tax=Actinokineospora sp. UTMC 2448 TaxID=2268449 RepID=UPI002164380A|nr:cellulose-binding protein [Actinokineospora sp. UTMC 2448]UVS80365.1 hypothetical protein Actkin_04116 [Actinokineospora sp. UTMC 2448]
MTAVDTRSELVPLRTDFDLVWRGCDPGQVRRYVEETEVELRLLAADRDAAAARADDLARLLDQARAEVRDLRARVDRLSRTPVDPATLPERLRRMVDLAHEQAAEITGRAQSAAEQHWAAAEQAAARARERTERLLADLETRRRDLESEHRALLRQAHDRIATMTRAAEHRRRDLDERAAALREQVQSDFETAMAARRAEAMATLSKEETAARERASRIVADATAEAERRITAARRQVDELRAHRARIAESIQAAHRLLAAAVPLLHDDPPAADGEPSPSIPQGDAEAVTTKAPAVGVPRDGAAAPSEERPVMAAVTTLRQAAADAPAEDSPAPSDNAVVLGRSA